MDRSGVYRLQAFAILSFFGWVLVCSASPLQEHRADNQALLTKITAHKMTIRNQENKAIFEGAVVLTRGPMVIHSDRMVVVFKPNSESLKPRETPASPTGIGGGESIQTVPQEERSAGRLPVISNHSVNTVEATGHVVIEKEGARAMCGTAMYYEEEEKIVLRDNPVAWQNGSKVTGKKITLFLAEDRSVVEGSSQVTIESSGAGRIQ